ncbi:MAG TPA: hypothetical protein DCQ32_03280 [Cyanobacteria bacterium UBA8156]|jgi:hypothetical protein|nr:hypothetical protein [Cyanobacteria bacterium UBA8156]
MKTVKLNLQEEAARQKLRQIAVGFLTDRLEAIAPERTRFQFDRQTLSLTVYALEEATAAQLEVIAEALQEFLSRLPLVGVRQIELEFLAPDEVTVLWQQGFAVTYEAPVAAIARPERRGQTVRRRGTYPGSALVARARHWLTTPETWQQAGRLGTRAVRDPKGALVQTGVFLQAKFGETLDWIDTFPWAERYHQLWESQRRRHRRNYVKALIEDLAVFFVVALVVLSGINAISMAPISLSRLPAGNHDTTLSSQRYRCAFLPGVNKTNYLCLSQGMGYRQVTSILGGEGKPMVAPTPVRPLADFANPKAQPPRETTNIQKQPVVVSWSQGNFTVNATFAGDRLIRKAYRES